MRKKGFTLIELLVVIAIIAMLLAILMPALSKVKKIAMRVVCATNLKGLGTAQTVYANDYDDEYAVQGAGKAQVWGTAMDTVTTDWNLPAKAWADGQTITVGASLFLLVREADVSPKSFVCPSGGQQEWDGITAAPGAAVQPDIVEVWDFGGPNYNNMGPMNTVSYSYHNPYAANGKTAAQGTGSKGRYAADGTRSAAFAVMADRNPFFDEKLQNTAGDGNNYRDHAYLLAVKTWNGSAFQSWEVDIANSGPHDRENQNVLFSDGHASNEDRSDVSIKNDNIYTYQNATTELGRRAGLITTTTLDAYPRASEDSMLVNDGGVR
jgi:prepilin-type N-terminal cleavage/methylation domain-containing protein